MRAYKNLGSTSLDQDEALGMSCVAKDIKSDPSNYVDEDKAEVREGQNEKKQSCIPRP